RRKWYSERETIFAPKFWPPQRLTSSRSGTHFVHGPSSELVRPRISMNITIMLCKASTSAFGSLAIKHLSGKHGGRPLLPLLIHITLKHENISWNSLASASHPSTTQFAWRTLN